MNFQYLLEQSGESTQSTHLGQKGSNLTKQSAQNNQSDLHSNDDDPTSNRITLKIDGAEETRTEIDSHSDIRRT